MNEPAHTMCIIDSRFHGLRIFSLGETLSIQVVVYKAALELSSDLEGLPVTRSARSKPCSSLDKLLQLSTEIDDTSSEDFSLEQKYIMKIKKYFRGTPVDKKTNHFSGGTITKSIFHSWTGNIYVYVSATSTPAERLFSAAGNISDRK